MKYAKLMREVFRANARTEAYLETSAYWQHCFAEMTFLYLRPLARHWGLPMEAVKDEVFNTHNGDVRWTLLFTQTITSTWGVEEATLLSGYLETRAWREGSVGRRYLNALAQSSFGRLEVVRSRPGVAYSVRAYGSNDDPISIPHRFSGDSPPVGACLAGRVISMQGRHQMSTVSMTLNQRLAGQLHAASIELRVIVKTLLDKWQIHEYTVCDSATDYRRPDCQFSLDKLMLGEVQLRHAIMVFCAWTAARLYRETELQHLLDHCASTEPIRYNYECAENAQSVKQKLDDHPHLRRSADDSWSLCLGGSMLSAPGLADIRLSGSRLTLETPFVEAARQGAVLIQTALADQLVEAGADVVC